MQSVTGGNSVQEQPKARALREPGNKRKRIEVPPLGPADDVQETRYSDCSSSLERAVSRQQEEGHQMQSSYLIPNRSQAPGED